MSKLESIVPPLELCKQIPAGEFEDSALVWDIHGHGKFDKWHVEKRVNRSVRFGDYGIMSPPHADIPAPTLAEILAKIPAAINGVGVLELALDDRAENNDGRYVICYNRYGVDGALEETTQLESDNNSATAALRLWLRVRQEAGR